MQNDILYNQVMKKILIIDMGLDENNQPIITGANMKPSEVLQYNMLPIVGFVRMAYGGGEVFDMFGYYEYIPETSIGLKSLYMEFLIASDTVNNEWILSE